MYPTLYETSGVGIHLYGLMILAAFCAAFGLVHWRSIQIGFHPDKLIGVYVASAVGGMLGGRLLYVAAVEPAKFLENPGSLFALSGFAVYGGIIGGALGVAAVSRFMGLNTWKMADVAAPAVILGMGIGRIGCFFAGCCYGVDAQHALLHPILPEELLHGQVYTTPVFPWIVNTFDDGVGRMHVPLYPTQLWSVVVLCSLAAVLASLWHKRRFDGQIGAMALLLEPIARILIEAFRADQRGYVVTFPVIESVDRWFPGLAQAGEVGESARMGITTSQGLGLGAMVFGAIVFAVRWNAGITPEIPVTADPDLAPAVER